MDILFVCTGNTCRSPMADAYLKHICKQQGKNDISVHSAGTFASNGSPASNQSITVMEQNGIDLTKHRSSALTESMINDADMIICMTENHRQQILNYAKWAKEKTSLLLEHLGQQSDIPDPFGGTIADYQKCFDSIKEAVDRLILKL